MKQKRIARVGINAVTITSSGTATKTTSTTIKTTSSTRKDHYGHTKALSLTTKTTCVDNKKN